MSASKHITKEDQQAIVAAIVEAEECSSGEIRVHIDEHCKADPLDRAATIFAKLKMHKTELRNGVLFYVAIKDKKLAIIGDVGINSRVPENYWDDIKEAMIPQFASNNLVKGLCDGVRMAGNKLKELFPCQKNDVNELSNEISF